MRNKLCNLLKKAAISVLCISTILMSIPFSVQAAVEASDSGETNASIENIYVTLQGIINWGKTATGATQQEYLFNDKFIQSAGVSTDWYAFGVGRCGFADDYSSYLSALENYIASKYSSKSNLSESKPTEWHRTALADLACGSDPTAIFSSDGEDKINLIADGTYNMEMSKLKSQGLNAVIWSLITLDSMRYDIPDDALNTRNDFIEEIISNQISDGGFSLDVKESDVDLTAMAVQALAPYYNNEKSYTYTLLSDNKEVSKTVREVVDDSLKYLSDSQQESGDFTSWGSSNSESTAQVIVALCALGINPDTDSRFIKNGNTAIDGLMEYLNSDGGFIHSKEYDKSNPTSSPDKSNSIAGEQALYSLTAYCRFKNSLRSLYDCRPEMSNENKNSINTLTNSIDKLSDSSDVSSINKLFSQYENVPVSERNYVYNYYKLADLMKEKGIENTSLDLTKNMGLNTRPDGSVYDILNHTFATYSSTEFTSEDEVSASALPEQNSTADYGVIVKLLYTLRHASNRNDYSDLEASLNTKLSQVKALQDEVNDINQTIYNNVYPIDKITSDKKPILDDIVKRYEALDTYEQTQIQGYQDVQTCLKKLASSSQNMTIIIAAAIVVVVVIILIIILNINRKKKLQREKDKLFQ